MLTTIQLDGEVDVLTPCMPCITFFISDNGSYSLVNNKIAVTA